MISALNCSQSSVLSELWIRVCRGSACYRYVEVCGNSGSLVKKRERRRREVPAARPARAPPPRGAPSGAASRRRQCTMPRLTQGTASPTIHPHSLTETPLISGY